MFAYGQRAPSKPNLTIDLSKVKKLLHAVRRWLFEDVPSKNQPIRRSLVKKIRVCYYVFKDYNNDFLLVRASALTYFTVLSIVPLLALAFGIAKGFGLEAYLAKQILENFSSQKEVMEQLLDYSHSMLHNTQGGLVAGVGALVLIWTVMRLFTNIEDSFNAIWNVRISRPLIRKFTDYISMMLLTPIFVIVSSSATVYLEIFIKDLTASYAILGFLGELYVFLIKLVPYISTWILFSLLFLVMPYTKVKPQFALLAGILTGTMYQAIQYFYISFQVNVSNFNAVYGSFAALPLFLVWLQLSWLVILLGAEITYYSQHVDDFDIKEKTRNLSTRQKKVLALAVMRQVVLNHRHAKPPISTQDISRNIGVPLNLVKEAMLQLTGAGLATGSEPDSADSKTGFLPALDSSLITVSHVLAQLDTLHQEEWQPHSLDDFIGIERILAKSESLFAESEHNTLLHEIKVA